MNEPFNDNDDDKVDLIAVQEATRTHSSILKHFDVRADARPNSGTGSMVVAAALFQTNALLMDLEAQMKRIADALQNMEDKK
jgi:hypothetical protein